MKVISGLKPVLYGVPNKETESVPKLGIHISPEIELKLETVRLVWDLPFKDKSLGQNYDNMTISFFFFF